MPREATIIDFHWLCLMFFGFSRFRALDAPRRPKRLPILPNEGWSGSLEGSKTGREGSKTAHEAPKTAHEAPKTAPKRTQKGGTRTESPSLPPQGAPRRLQETEKGFLRGSQEGSEEQQLFIFFKFLLQISEFSFFRA